jgi:8-oxo-dGTP pyrophosphatase MutT (NUDIX family)
VPATSQIELLRTDGRSFSIRVQRNGYRLASQLIGADRRIRSSHGRGVKLVLSDFAGRILLVRHTYGSRHWTFPGGGVRSQESPLDAAVRESVEELAVVPDQIELLGTHPARSRRRREVISVFHGHTEGVLLSPSSIELDSIGWFPQSGLPDDRDPNVATALGLLDGRNAEIAAARHHAA